MSKDVHKMRLVKVKQNFYNECKKHNTDEELMFNECGRPCVLIVQLKYKGKLQKFVVPLRSNISGKTPKKQYCSLPPNADTRSGNSHGIHYIKLFPIKDQYIDTYLIKNDPYKIMIKGIIDKKEPEIIKACKEYLEKVEAGNKHSMTPNIDGILSWL